MVSGGDFRLACGWWAWVAVAGPARAGGRNVGGEGGVVSRRAPSCVGAGAPRPPPPRGVECPRFLLSRGGADLPRPLPPRAAGMSLDVGLGWWRLGLVLGVLRRWVVPRAESWRRLVLASSWAAGWTREGWSW